MTDWLALVIGNTRWHWAWFQESELKHVWHGEHLSSPQPPALTLRSLGAQEPLPPELLDGPLAAIDIWAVSVVPTQAQYLNALSTVHWIHNIPLKKVYPTMGLDRVVTLWGAGQRYGWPVLVIDGGTALTFTAGTEGALVGGAILLGVRSHLAALHHVTAALPIVSPPGTLPPRWAVDTPSAIQSGVIHTVLASIDQYIQHWQQKYPESAIIFTGGDGDYLHHLYQQHSKQNQTLFNRIWFDPNLMFWGITHYRKDATRAL